MVVVQIAGGEACQALIVQGVRRGGASFDDVAFVELEFYFAGDILLGGLYESLYSLAERCEPFSFIYDAGKFAALPAADAPP